MQEEMSVLPFVKVELMEKKAEHENGDATYGVVVTFTPGLTMENVKDILTMAGGAITP